MSFDVEKIWETKVGYAAVCIALKNMYRCGYVGLPLEHFLYGIGYSQSTEKLKRFWQNIMAGSEKEPNKRGPIITFLASFDVKSPDNWSPDKICNAHGGLTYSGGKDYPIKNEKKLWWFGFDCGHNGDGYFEGNPIFAPTSCIPVRSMDYVIEECESLAKQFKVIAEAEAEK